MLPLAKTHNRAPRLDACDSQRPCRGSFVDISTTFRSRVGGSADDSQSRFLFCGRRRLENGLNGFHVRSRFPRPFRRAPASSNERGSVVVPQIHRGPYRSGGSADDTVANRSKLVARRTGAVQLASRLGVVYESTGRVPLERLSALISFRVVRGCLQLSTPPLFRERHSALATRRSRSRAY